MWPPNRETVDPAARWPVDAAVFPGWDGSVAGARTLQAELAAGLKLEDDFAAPLRVIAGVDVGFEDEGRTTRAAAVLLDADSLAPIAEALIRLPTGMPYVSGLLSFRELPAVVAAVRALPQVPDLVVCDGQGIAHPRRFGIAAHFGAATGLPAIGVAKQRLYGRHEEVGAQRGERMPLVDPRGDRAQLGWVLRSKDGVAPLIVSPGHRVSVATAANLVLRFTLRHRLPEPTRLADRLASRRAGVTTVTPAPRQGLLL